jgi:predicted branched-subunit amino acid permease
MDSTDTITDPSPVAPATFLEGFKDRHPIVLSYVPVAFPFSLNATKPGVSPLHSVFFFCIIVFSIPTATLMSCVNALFTVLGLSFWTTRRTIIPTFSSALAYGITWKLLTVP